MNHDEKIHFDAHIHSDYSDGKMDLYRIAKHVVKKDLAYVGIADHCSHHAFGSNMVKKHNVIERQQLIETLNERMDPTLLNCIEADIHPKGTVVYPRGIEKKFFDFVIGSVHASFDSESWKHALKRVIRDKKIDVFGHPMAYNDISWNAMEEIALEIARSNIAVELNEKYPLPPKYFLTMLQDHNVEFVLASDAHTLNDIGRVKKSLKFALENNLSLKDPITFPMIKKKSSRGQS